MQWRNEKICQDIYWSVLKLFYCSWLQLYVFANLTPKFFTKNTQNKKVKSPSHYFITINFNEYFFNMVPEYCILFVSISNTLLKNDVWLYFEISKIKLSYLLSSGGHARNFLCGLQLEIFFYKFNGTFLVQNSEVSWLLWIVHPILSEHKYSINDKLSLCKASTTWIT